MSRGVLTDKVKKVSKEQFGYEINVRQLRLLPYLQYCLINNQRMDNRHLNTEECDILDAWVMEGFIIDWHDVPEISKKFYHIICEMLLISYCSEYVI